MNIKMVKHLILPFYLLWLTSITVFPARAENALENWEIRHFNWERSIRAKNPVEVNNPYGDVRIRRGPDSTVFIYAITQKHKNDPDDPKIIIKTGEGLSVDVTYPKNSTSMDGISLKTNTKRRVDLTLFIPKGSSLDVQTYSGKIIAKGLQSDVQAKTDSGKIFLRISGTAKAVSDSGELVIFLKDPSWSWPPVFETSTGDISVRMPKNADVAVDISTAGEITTDYSIQIISKPDSRIKQGNALILKGRQNLWIKSIEGNIKILRPLQ